MWHKGKENLVTISKQPINMSMKKIEKQIVEQVVTK